ncbi:hypothetical protein RRG08_060598 [Elysia crispata]|uniref:Uncharacterized protein n=1 Tax=Elysia crispata TaxID=231223 RepID=A0AAE1ANV6_9GAST|nr:hypothetical protein RRG08_060598 [Elysia crispata]
MSSSLSKSQQPDSTIIYKNSYRLKPARTTANSIRVQLILLHHTLPSRGSAITQILYVHHKPFILTSPWSRPRTSHTKAITTTSISVWHKMLLVRLMYCRRHLLVTART